MKRKTQVLAASLASLLLPVTLLAGATSPTAEAATVVPAVTTVATNGTLSFNPVASSSGGSVTATFTGKAKVKNRPVVLRKSTDGGVTWASVGSKVKLSSSGVVVFKVTATPGVSYKAAAAAYKYKVKKKKVTAAEVETPVQKVEDDWTSVLPGNFTSTATNWTHAVDGNYAAVGRWCSAPTSANMSVSGGVANLKVTQVTNTTKVKSVVAAAKAKQEAARNAAITAAKTKAQLKAAKAMKVDGCPNGVFDNVRASTEAGSFSIKTGIVAAKVTLPIYQGMHGGVWLQSKSGSEIDMVEAFGWKKGIQNTFHVAGRKDESESKKWTAKSTVKKSSWWGKAHVFSVEWTRDTIIYRIDGVQTKKVSKAKLPDTQYFLVISMLTSDWETGRLKKPVNGGKKAPSGTTKGTMKVDWVKAWTKVG